jgi:hypothetical protein
MRSSPDRGQTEPLAALVAVVALASGLSLYVGAFDSTVATLTADSEITPTAADGLTREASSFGTVQPPIDDAVADARPDGYRMSATLRAGGSTWTGGPPRQEGADCVDRLVSVRTAPGRVRPGRLEVCVWPAA